MKSGIAWLSGLVALTLSVSACDAFSSGSSSQDSQQQDTPAEDSSETSGASGQGDSDASTATGDDTDLATATGGDTDSQTATALPTGGDMATSTGDTDVSTATAGAEEPEGSADAPTQTPADRELEEPSLDPAQSSPSGQPDLLSTSVRIGAHEDYDRVVFDLEGEGTPGYSVSYVQSAVESGSGAVLDVDGDAVLQVVITGTRYPDETEAYEGGPGVYALDAADVVEEVRLSGTYEGRTQAFIGVDDQDTPFRVFTLSDPARVVVDVAHEQ
ncbi:MAG TPA: hypothetical protein VJ976_00185 [Ornithinimicrobium sp.]|uniref:AMIN-like domain-containing (lipo)protein n=1 Tax=Ornithinimicrobium sp. TaxID=1977084 RepID=UPI002B48E5A6|nr:hypothetical protein [Ornithinimicrobium sp.]HKJ10785.1 hypothetical protein [Ornithinimicrobium sp.]